MSAFCVNFPALLKKKRCRVRQSTQIPGAEQKGRLQFVSVSFRASNLFLWSSASLSISAHSQTSRVRYGSHQHDDDITILKASPWGPYSEHELLRNLSNAKKRDGRNDWWNPFPWCPSLPCKKQGLFPPLAILNYQVLNFWENKLFFLATMAISIGFASPQQHPLQWPSLDFDPRHLLNHGWEGTNRTRTQMFKNTLQQGLMKVMKVMKVFKSNFLQIKDDHRSDEI